MLDELILEAKKAAEWKQRERHECDVREESLVRADEEIRGSASTRAAERNSSTTVTGEGRYSSGTPKKAHCEGTSLDARQEMIKPELDAC